jgi:hypothetical protein
MSKIRIFVIFFCIFSYNVVLAHELWAEPVAISGLGVDNADGQVSVGFNIVIQDLDSLLEALGSGGDYEVRCTGKLYQRRAGFWNSLMSENSYNCLVSGKSIARECVVQDFRGTKTIEFADLETELTRHWSGLSIPMGDWDMIERNRAYRLMLTFQITRTNIPGWVSKPLFFVSWDLVPATVYTFDFDY